MRKWESREKHKAREAAKEKEKKKIKEEERQKEAKRLKEFLEDYDDEKDDIKYYKLVSRNRCHLCFPIYRLLQLILNRLLFFQGDESYKSVWWIEKTK